MAKQKKVNKGLVGGLTVAGIILSVLIVVIVTLQSQKKDPELFAGRARDHAQAGEVEPALALFLKAYELSGKDTAYALEASDALFEGGEVARAFGLLQMVADEKPEDGTVLTGILEKFWEIKVASSLDGMWNTVLEVADKALRLDENNVLAMLLKAEALRGLPQGDKNVEPEAEALVARAVQIDPHDPRVAFSQAMEMYRAAVLDESGGLRAEPDAARLDALEQMMAAAVAEHPADENLVTLYAQVLVSRDKFKQAEQLLERAREGQPDAARFDLVLGQLLWSLTRQSETAPADVDARAAMVDRARALLNEAVEEQPATYEAYTTLAAMHLAPVVDDEAGATPAQRGAGFEAALQVYTDALERTVGLRTLAAAMSRTRRIMLVLDAFDLSLRYYRSAATGEQRESAKQFAEQFLATATTEYPTAFITPLMQGELAFMDRRWQDSIRAFQELEQKTGELAPRMQLKAKERLAALYQQEQQDGLAREYAEQAVALYKKLGAEPPLNLLVSLADLYNRLELPQDTLDLVALIELKHPNEPLVMRAKAMALALLGRSDEADALLAKLSEGDNGGLARLARARVAAFNKDYGEAERLLREALDAEPKNVEALRLLTSVAAAADRGPAVAEYLGGLAQRVDDEPYRRTITAFQALASSKNQAERDAKILEMIEKLDDERARTGELYNFYIARQRYDEASKYLKRLAELAPEDMEIQRQLFLMALQTEDFATAERLVVDLAQRNVDRANGAVLRGQLAAAKGDYDQAVNEFRAARRELPRNADIEVRLAQALLGQKPSKTEEAYAALQNATSWEPRSFSANKLMFLVCDSTGRTAEAEQYLEQAYKLQPGDPQIAAGMARLEERRDPAASIAKREALRAEDPENTDNLMRLAELYARVGDVDKSLATIDTLADRSSDLRLAALALPLYLQRNDRAGGEQLLQKLLSKASGLDRTRGRVLLARYYDGLGDSAAAEKSLQETEQQLSSYLSTADDVRAGQVLVVSELADLYERRGKTDALVAASRRLLTLLPAESDEAMRAVRFRLIDALTALERFGEATEEAERFAQAYPDDVRALTARANLLLRQRKFDEAYDLLSRAIQQQPDNAWAYANRGALNIEQKRYDQAQRDLLRSKELAPLGFGLVPRLNLARLYELTNQPTLAEAELRELLDAAPQDRRSALTLLRLYRNTGQAGKAQELVAELSAQQPNEPFWPFQLGSLLMEREEFSAAIRPLEQAVQLAQGRNPQYVAGLLQALISAGRPAEAIAWYEGKVGEGQRVPGVRGVVAEAYLRNQQPDKARQELSAGLANAAARGFGDVAFIASRAAELFGGQEAVALVRGTLNEGTANEVAQQRLRLALAQYLIISGQLEEGQQLSEQLLGELREPTLERIAALMVRGQLLDKQGRYEELVKCYEQLLELDPGNLQALNNLSYTLVDQLKRPAAALPYAERLHTAAGENPNVLDTVGLIYLENDRADEAEAVLRDALRFDPNHLAARYHLGQAQVKQGARRDAEKTFTQCLEVARRVQNNDYIGKAEQALAALR